MTSKISCIKLIRAELKQRGWLLALTCIVLFLSMPVYSMMWLDAYMTNYGPSEYITAAEMYTDIRNMFPGLINGFRFSILTAAFAVFGALSAAAGFGYIHSREKLDFYHALPIRRSRRFAVSWLCGLLTFVVPYVICAALTVAAGAVQGIMDAQLAAACALAALAGILCFLLVYHTCILGFMLSGRTPAGLLAALAIFVYASLVLGTISSLQNVYFKTYYSPGETLSDRLMQVLSPLGLFSAMNNFTGMNGFSPVSFILAAVMSCLLLGAALILYRRYPSEAAGNALSFPAAAPFAKVAVCIPASIFLSLFAQAFTGAAASGWIFPLSILAALILCALIEFIYRMDLRQLLKGWKSSLVSVAGVAAVLCIFQFDLFGYDTYLPREDQIESIRFRADSFPAYLNSVGYSTGYDDADLYYFGAPAPDSSTHLLYTLAQSGVRSTRDESTGSEENILGAAFCFELESGRSVTRWYTLNFSDAYDIMEELFLNEDYRRSLFPVFTMDREQISGVSLSDAYATSTELPLSEEERNSLLDACEKDLLAVDFSVLQNESPLAELSLDIPDPYAVTSLPASAAADTAASKDSSLDPDSLFTVRGLYIYPGYVNTLDWLEEHGYRIRTEIDPQDVAELTLTLSLESVQSGRYDSLIGSLSGTAVYTEYGDSGLLTVSDTEDIAAVLENTEQYWPDLLGNRLSSGDYLDIRYLEGKGSAAYDVI